MKAGAVVTWTDVKAGNKAGHGVTISDEVDGHVLVAVDADETSDAHSVIWCTVTWLTVAP